MKRFWVRVLSCLVPVGRWRKKIRKIANRMGTSCLREPDASKNISLCRVVQALHAESIVGLREKIRNKEKIRVWFLVIYGSVFPARPLFEKMLENNDMFDPVILVVPDVLRGETHMFEQMEKTFEELSRKYNVVIGSYDKTKKAFVDFYSQMDLVCFACPYSSMTWEYYKPDRLQSKLSIYIPYGYTVSNWYEKSGEPELLFWKTFVANRWQLNSMNYGAEFLGYVKMDDLAKYKPIERKRKRIIISPHHTVLDWVGGVEFSNFIKYADFFLELPKWYPDVDFIFRPHPLLFVNLERNAWGKERTQEYLRNIKSNVNVVYDTAPEYFSTFVNSDALIHDCGSFMAEYLFVGKPACYLLKDDTRNASNYNDFACECLDKHYKAYEVADIVEFIDRVLAGSDIMKETRDSFVQKELMVGYPHSATRVLQLLKSEFQGEDEHEVY